MEVKCELCDREVKKTSRHHLVPKQKGGNKGDTIDVCYPCKDMIHRLIDNYSLAKIYNTLEKLKQASPLRKYLNWIRKRGNETICMATKKKR